MALGLLLSDSSSRPAATGSSDSIYSGMILSDLERYNDELSPLETMYRDRLLGPQSEQDRSKGLQTVAGNTDNAFGRAAARINERRRATGQSGDMSADDNRRLRIAQNVTKAKATTDFARFYDRTRTDLL